MGTTTDLRRELKTRFFPYVEAKGFELDEREAPLFWMFRRVVSHKAQVFSVQWDKYGRPRFRLDFGTCPIEGLNVGGQHIDWTNMHPHWLPDAGTLKAVRGMLARTWFCQDRAMLHRVFGAGPLRAASEVVDELLFRYPEMETYLTHGTTGKNVHRWSRQ